MAKRIIRSLFQNDVVMASLARKYELPKLRPRELFFAVTRNIIGQQLSGKVADVIVARFTKVVGFVSPQAILAVSDQKLRDAGLSWAKVKYVKALAQAVSSGTLDLEMVKTLPDEEAVLELTKVKGIGRWTAEMVLIFHLQRPDVFSLGDLGLRTAISKIYKVDRNDLRKIAKISEKWKPHRSLACRYLWKSLENE